VPTVSHTTLRLVGLAAVVWLLGLSAGTTSAGTAHPSLRLVATGLDNPRKIFLGAGGAVYVAEAGTGGTDECLGTGASKACIGLTGSITRIAKGVQTRVVTGLVSFAHPNGQAAQGPADVLLRGRTFYVLLQDSSINSIGANGLGPDGVYAGDLISSPAGKAAATVIVSLAAFEAAHNPDHGAGPGARFGDPPIDSDPYAFTAYRGGFAVVDAAGNDLLWISPGGAVSVLAVFPTQTERLTRAIATRIGAPATMRSIAVQSVPTSVTVGPDGALYVGELTGAPYQPGRARIWRIAPGKKLTLYASGFTNISDLAFDGKNLLVLEIASKGLLDPSSSGALIELAPDGKRRMLASTGLVDPTGLAVGNGTIYISNDGVFPGTGPGLHGEVVSLPASVGS
jgi:hypothetical protein